MIPLEKRKVARALLSNREQLGAALSMSKYQSIPKTVDGIKFASTLEADRYIMLKALESQGLISGLETQVKFQLIPSIYEGERGKRKCVERGVDYFADFVYYDTKTGERIVEDAKGFRTPVYTIKRKLMLWIHGIKIKEWPDKKGKSNEYKIRKANGNSKNSSAVKRRGSWLRFMR